MHSISTRQTTDRLHSERRKVNVTTNQKPQSSQEECSRVGHEEECVSVQDGTGIYLKLNCLSLSDRALDYMLTAFIRQI